MSTGLRRCKREGRRLIRQLLYVVFFVQVGLLLIVLPWWPAFWDHNYFAFAWPWLQPLLANNFVRGAVSGLGLVNLFAGFADLALVFASRDRDRATLHNGHS
ncbi:MAG: hypothetical protein DMF98_22360 [Acidobacteria bacterium]|nr:MAG: hypothetical protein DMF98_22360 [Acidobacteriota bacterium]